MGTPAAGELTEAQLEQRAQAHVTHGAQSYGNRTATGQLVTATMRLVESEVVRLFAEGGERAMIEGAAVRFETMARLVYQHLERATPEDAVHLALLWRRFQRDAVHTWAAHAALASGDEPPVSAGKVLESLNGNPES